MKKKIYLSILLILSILLGSCADYTPIFGSSNLNFEIANYSIKGNKKLGKNIYSKLNNLLNSRENNSNNKTVTLLIDVSESKVPTTKDSSGKVLEYKLTLSTKIIIKDYTNNNLILDQKFLYTTTYKVQTQYSESIEYERTSIENLMEKTYQEIVDAFAQYLYDKQLLDNEESEGSLVFELTENKGAKVIVTPSPKEDENKESEYTVEHLDVDLENKGDE